MTEPGAVVVYRVPVLLRAVEVDWLRPQNGAGYSGENSYSHVPLQLGVELGAWPLHYGLDLARR